MGSSVSDIGKGIENLTKDTAGFFTGGTSGVNVAQGKAPTEQTLATDAAGLAAGAGLAGAGLGGTAAGAGEAATSASPQGLNPALAGGSGEVGLNPAAGGGVGLNAATGGAAFNSALSPELQSALGAGADSALQAMNASSPIFSGGNASVARGGASPAVGGGAPGGVAPSAVTGGAPAAAGGGMAPTAVTAQQASGSEVDKILGAMRQNAGLASLGLSAAGMAAAGRQRQVPNEQQLNDLAATGSQAAKDLISSYRTGQVSAAQQAQLDQLTQQTKNQINQYFASIGQSDSTAHQQALAQVDQQALGMKQQMLDNMLQQGLQAIGVAAGPLSTVANYQIQADKNLTDAFGNFANAVGQAFGRTPGTAQDPNKKIAGGTPSSDAVILGGSSVGSTPSSTPSTPGTP